MKIRLNRKDIEKGIIAFKKFRKANKTTPMFYSDVITNEQVAIYVLFTLKCIKKELSKSKKQK